MYWHPAHCFLSPSFTGVRKEHSLTNPCLKSFSELQPLLVTSLLDASCSLSPVIPRVFWVIWRGRLSNPLNGKEIRLPLLGRGMDKAAKYICMGNPRTWMTQKTTRVTLLWVPTKLKRHSYPNILILKLLKNQHMYLMLPLLKVFLPPHPPHWFLVSLCYLGLICLFFGLGMLKAPLWHLTWQDRVAGAGAVPDFIQSLHS